MKKNLFLFLSAAALLVSCGEPSTSKPAEGGKSSEPQVTTPSQAGGDSSSDPASGEGSERTVSATPSRESADKPEGPQQRSDEPAVHARYQVEREYHDDRDVQQIQVHILSPFEGSLRTSPVYPFFGGTYAPVTTDSIYR